MLSAIVLLPTRRRSFTGQFILAGLTALRRLGLVIGLCWLVPLSAQETAVATPDEAGQGPALSTTRLAGINGRQVEYWASRAPQARASLVFENGLMLPLTSWQAVASALADSCNMVAYNRPGVGRSELPDLPQEADQAAGDLLALLRSQGLEPPYILVGHSLGGQYAQLFAGRHPDLVSGMVLVDALPIGVVKPAAQFPWFTRLGLWLFAPEYARREIGNIHPMGETLLAGSRLQGKPIVRLVAQSAAPKPEGLIKDLLKGVILAEDFGVWAVGPDEAEARMNRLYPQSLVKPVQAHHRIQEVAPGVVVEAIRQVLDNPQGPNR